MAEILDPSNNQLENLVIQSPVSGFLSVYDGDVLIQSISVLPPDMPWPIYWCLSEGLSFVWDLHCEITITATLSGEDKTFTINHGRTDVFTLICEPDEDQLEHRVHHRGASPEQLIRDMQETQRDIENARRVGEAIGRAGVSASQAVAGLARAFGQAGQSIGNLGAPPQHPNCRSEQAPQSRTAIEEWREATAQVRPSLFYERPKNLRDKIREFITINDRELIKANKNFTWKTRDGEVKKIHEMTSQHLFYSMRMSYRRIKDLQREGETISWLPPVARQFTRQQAMTPSMENYNPPPPEGKRIMLVFMYHIEERRDLPLRCMAEYNEITAEMFGIDLPNQTTNSNFGSIVAGQDYNPTRRIQVEQLKMSSKGKNNIQRDLKKMGFAQGKRRLNVE